MWSTLLGRIALPCIQWGSNSAAAFVSPARHSFSDMVAELEKRGEFARLHSGKANVAKLPAVPLVRILSLFG